ncbi:hypothetical protein AB4144_13380 [Rhizobiaceae sp. 2RAB30]
MTAKSHARDLGRRSLLKALLAIPLAFAFRASQPVQLADEAKPDDIVEINGWILLRSDLS